MLESGKYKGGLSRSTLFPQNVAQGLVCAKCLYIYVANVINVINKCLLSE